MKRHLWLDLWHERFARRAMDILRREREKAKRFHFNATARREHTERTTRFSLNKREEIGAEMLDGCRLCISPIIPS